MLFRRRSRSGFAILCVLMTIVIIGILTTSYMAPVAPGGKPFPQTVIDRARGAVTVANLRTAQTMLMTAEMDGPLNVERRRDLLRAMPAPSDGGRYFIVTGAANEVYVTTMIQTPLWADRLKFPRAR